MSSSPCHTDTSDHSQVRERVADRLGFLFAKRWIRKKQPLELRGEETRSRPRREAEKRESSKGDENTT
jgi:hypothetical protein